MIDFQLISTVISKPWLIESQAAYSYLQLFHDVLHGKASFNFLENFQARISQFTAQENTVFAPIHRADAEEHPGYDGKTIAVVPISGPLTKANSCGWFGTASIRNELLKIDATPSIKTVILLIDSPGGTVDGTQALADTYRNMQKEKISFIDGMMCSAACWIGSGGDRVIASSQTDIIGSIGTMISFYDNTEALKKLGYELREYYADASGDKNKMFKDGKSGNGKLLIEQMLNPLNDVFLNHVKQNRAGKLNEAETLSGKTFLAPDALKNGLIDEISSFDTLINSLNKKSNTMSVKWKKISQLLGVSATDKVELTSEQLDKAETMATDLEKANSENAELKTKADAAEAARVTAAKEKDEATAALTTAQETIKTHEATITTLQEKVKTLESADGGKFTQTAGKEDTPVGGSKKEKYVTSYDKEVEKYI